MAVTADQTSTNVRSRDRAAHVRKRSRPGAVAKLATLKTAFRVMERMAPNAGAKLAERLWFTLPPGAGRAVPAPSALGIRFDVGPPGRAVVGWRAGTGRPVFLVHGWGGRAAQFQAMVPQLVTAGFQVFTFDAPSHGASDPGGDGPGRSSMLEFADALDAVAATYGPAYAVVGHSLGGTAVAYALSQGLTADRVAMIAPMADPRDHVEVVGQQLGYGDRIRSRMVARIEARFQRDMDDFSVPAMAPTVGLGRPLLVVHDVDDRETTHAKSAGIVSAWPGARMVTTQGLGHRRILRDPTVVNEIASFLS